MRSTVDRQLHRHSVIRTALCLLTALSGAVHAGSVASVNLGASNSLYAIATPGAANGGIGNDGYSYAAPLLGPSLTWNGEAFAITTSTAPSAAANTTIALPAGNFTSLSFLGSGIYGNQLNQVFSVTYTDGSTTTFMQSLSDWSNPQSYAGESVAATTAYRVTPSGAVQGGSWNLYGYSFALNGAKTVKSLTLPANGHVVVLAVDVANSGSASAVAAVNMASSNSIFAIAASGASNAGIGNDGYAYSAASLGTSLVWNGESFNLANATGPSAAAATTIPLPSGNFTVLNFLGTAIYGSQAGQVFTVTYTDGTTTSATMSLSDWSSPQSFPGESIVASTGYRVTPGGGMQAGPWYVYGYAIALNPAKTVKSMTLPPNSHVLVLAVDLNPAPAHATVCQTQAGGSFCSDGASSPADANGYHDLAWTNLNKALVSIAVSDNQVWGIDAAGILWYLPDFKHSGAWLKVASGVGQVSAGHNILCQLNTSQHLYCSSSPNPALAAPDANGFQSINWLDTGATNFTQISVSAGSLLWAVDTNSNLVMIGDYNHVATSSTLVASGVKQVAADGRGMVCQVNANQTVYCSDWSVPASTANPAPYHSLPWAGTGSTLQNIAAADGQIWGIDANGDAWQMPDHTNPATWYRIAHVGVGAQLGASSMPSQFVPTDFAGSDVALLMFMGQSNAVGVNVQPARFIAPASPNVWGVQNGGWNYLAGNANGTAPFNGAISSINMVNWTHFALTPTSADMNLGFNNDAGPGGDAANFAAFQWQGLINAGWKLPDLYIVHIGWPSQGVDPQDATTASAAWTAHGVNLWQPGLTAAQQPSYALAPFARTVVYRALQNLLGSGKTPRIIGLQWNQWEAEAGNSNPVSISDAPANYSALFNGFFSAIDANYPVQIVKPLSYAYGATPLAAMQAVFANLATVNPGTYSVLDASLVSSSIFSGGVLGGGDGSVHYNLDTHEWFATQAIGACVIRGNCGPRVASLPVAAPN